MAEPKIFSGWKVVLLSFLGAATFWFFSALGKDYSYRIAHPISFVFDTDSLIAVKPLPTSVDIDVSGVGWDLFKESFWFGADPVVIELENPAAIRFLTRPTILPILTDQLSQYRINYLFTDTLFIDIDRKASKKVNLILDSLTVSLEDDYRIVTPIKLKPDTAILYGPTSFLDTIGTDFRVKLDIDEIDKDFDRFVALDLPKGFDIYSEPPTLNIQFDVERFDRLSLQTQVELLNFPADSSVYVLPPTVTVKFVVQESLKEEYFAEDFKVVVDYSMINKADSTAPAMVVIHPETVMDVEVAPDSLSIFYVR
ncbi:MAG: YbbR-like domain-containing protein [Ekhidna sp.]